MRIIKKHIYTKMKKPENTAKSEIQKLKEEAQARGQQFVKRYQELENAEKQIAAEKKAIEKEVDLINGEINGYNKIELPSKDKPNQEPITS